MGSRKILLDCLHRNEQPAFTAMRDRYRSRDDYFRANMANTKAEFLTDCRVKQTLCRFKFSAGGVCSASNVQRFECSQKHADLVESAADHVVRSADGIYFYITKVAQKVEGPVYDPVRKVPIPEEERVTYFNEVNGFRVSEHSGRDNIRCEYLDAIRTDQQFFLVAFVRDAVKRHEAAAEMLTREATPVERCILRPEIDHPSTLNVNERPSQNTIG